MDENHLSLNYCIGPIKYYFCNMNLKKGYLNFWIRNTIVFLFFLGILVSEVITSPDSPTRLKDTFIIFFTLLLTYFLFTIHNVVLYEKFLKRKKYHLYIYGFIGLWLSYCLINIFTPFRFVHGNIITVIIGSLLMFIFGLGFYFVHKNIIEKNLSFQQEIYSKEEEIRYLKSQLNPHFLFNALNNLYGVALSNPSEAADKILELSELLRYQIEASKNEYALLSDEINYMKKYFSYELDRNPKLIINYKESGEPNHKSIAPLLMIPFIENAIKFSAETLSPQIDVTLDTQRNNIEFSIRNNYEVNGRVLVGTNTGILNTKKRLALIYENRHQLKIENENDTFTVRLSLEL